MNLFCQKSEFVFVRPLRFDSDVLPAISIIVSTLNREDLLRKAMESIARQTVPRDAFELIIVDNGSEDGTRGLVENWPDPTLNLHYIYEPVKGMSRARNSGARSARSGILAFLDDDAVAQENWVEQILKTFASVRPSPGCIGGIIATDWGLVNRPKWFTSELAGIIPTLDRGDKPHWLSGGLYNYETSLAIPRALFFACGGFPEYLGRRGRSLIGNEGQLLQMRLWDLGFGSYYNPTLVATHRLDPERLRPIYILRRCYWLGVSERVVSAMHQRSHILQSRWSLFVRYVRNAHPFILLCSLFWLLGYTAGKRVFRSLHVSSAQQMHAGIQTQPPARDMPSDKVLAAVH